ncbi:Vacuolar import and degradation protein 30 [Nakaseomyces bracarensis]|uniref:Vacuolar import and degradation protein 30 n=1 Tax=Nakaseomyces bracarensis TaxID=273131 RepID=A0ABR4NNK8_9SACH
MSGHMDEVDREFIKSLFPEYLLQQPVAYDLWWLYRENKKLFCKFPHYHQKEDDKKGMNNGNSIVRKKLSYATKKEIWQKLMNLGVLGTLSFDATNDEYLVQVYKYFYSVDGSNINAQNNIEKNGSESVRKNGKPTFREADDSLQRVHDVLDQYYLNSYSGDNVELENEDIETEDNRGSTEGIFNADEEVEDDDEDDDDDDGDDDDDDDEVLEDEEEEEEGADIDDERQAIAGEGADDQSGSTNEGSVQSLATVASIHRRAHSYSTKDDVVKLYPALGSQKIPSKKKNNTSAPDVYNLMGYFLPSQWIRRDNNSVIVSSDGITELSANPNWQPYLANDRGDTFARNRLRSALTSSQKTEFVTTHANEVISGRKVAIFYYEVRILDVTSSKSAQNSNIVVGYKLTNDSDDDVDLAKIDEKTLLELVRNSGALSVDFGGTNEIGGTLMGRSEATAVDPSGGLAKRNSLDEAFVGYCGSSGNITLLSKEKPYSKPYGRDDVIGCGINFVDGSVFFTKNGVYLGDAICSLMDVNVIPYIALKSGNSVRTNFGLYEEFVFDINKYQRKWKRIAYNNIFKASSTVVPHKSEDSTRDESQMDIDEEETSGDSSLAKKGILLGKDERLEDPHMHKPDSLLINTLNTQDGSMISTLNIMVNDYLIHEGLIDVAKGFLKDLQKFSLTNPYDDQIQLEEREVIKHNELQIIREENVLRIRQELRKLINDREIQKCIAFLNQKIPELLIENVELKFELCVAQYLIQISNSDVNSTDKLIESGQNLSREFVFNESIPEEQRNKFKNLLSDISSLLVYEDPLNEAPEELSYYLSAEYLQDRLFQITNSQILTHLKKSSECILDDVVSSSRAMSLTLMGMNAKGTAVVEEDGSPKVVDTPRYYKLVNIDGDLLSLQ